MKSIISTLFFCLVFTPFLIGQWSQIETLKGGDVINDIIEYKNDIYISTSDNSLFRSTDQGITWTQPTLPQRWRIDDMTIYKDSLFAVVSGALLKSVDGLNWTKFPLFETSINQIVAIEDTLYLSCYNGIWRSDNGGKDWIDINNSETVTGINCVAKNGNVLFAGGKSGKLYKSLNGGSSWETINTNTTSEISQVYVSNGCIFINLFKIILKSEDNGLNWISIAPTTYNSYFYLKNAVGFVVSSNTVYKSIDNGESWSGSGFKLPNPYACTMYFNESYVFAGFSGAGVSRNSIALDEEWITSNEGLILMDIHKILEKDSIIYVGTEFNFVYSNNKEGAAWRPEKSANGRTDGNARSMAIIGDYILIGQGGGGIQRKKKTDEKWEHANEGLDGLIIEDLCANKNFAFAAVNNKGVYRTENYGTTWIKKSSGINTNIKTLYATDDKIFVGTWSGIYLSEDNGESWKDISNALPGKSIEKIVYFDTCLFVATTWEGLYRSYDFGAHWTQILPDDVTELSVYNKNLFVGSWKGSIKMSKNLGETWINTDIKDYDGIIQAIGFSENYIYAGGTQPGRGLWKRPLHQILPPSYKFYSTSSDTKFKGDDKLYIKSDLALKNNSGDSLSSSMLIDFVKVLDGSDLEVAFTSSIDSDTKLIKIEINSPTLNEKYKIVVQPLKNESGQIIKETISQYFTYVENHLPVISNIELSGIKKNKIFITSTNFLNAYTDIDKEQIASIKVIQLPKNGNLSLKGENLNVGDEIPFSKIDSIVYISNNDFEGEDRIVWNASDGYNYSENNASINIKVSIRTAIENNEINPELKIYPNPASGNIVLSFENQYYGGISIKIIDLTGNIIIVLNDDKSTVQFTKSISLNDVARGIYLVKVKYTNSDHEFSKKLIIQ